MPDSNGSYYYLVESKTMKGYIKCKFCSWKIKRWRTNKKGQKIHGQSALERHVYVNHPEEWEKIHKEEAGLVEE